MNGDDLMELLQLYYFKVLAEREHLTRTAESLMIAAPSLSATISRLENELGVKLFDRVGRNIRLNENGRILQRYVNEIFDALQNAKTELKDAGTTASPWPPRPSLSGPVRSTNFLRPTPTFWYSTRPSSWTTSTST